MVANSQTYVLEVEAIPSEMTDFSVVLLVWALVQGQSEIQEDGTAYKVDDRVPAGPVRSARRWCCLQSKWLGYGNRPVRGAGGWGFLQSYYHRYPMVVLAGR